MLVTRKMACLHIRDEEIEQMYTDDESKDLVFEFDDGERIKMHSFLAVTMSPVFRRMLEINKKEGKDKVLNIVGDKKAFKDMVKFLYVPKIQTEGDSNHEDLLKIADDYNVQCLHEYISRTLEIKLSDKNALDIAMLAKTYHAPKLYAVSVKYVLTNIGHSLNVGWEKKIERFPDIAIKILKEMRKSALTIHEFNGLDFLPEIQGMQLPRTAAIKFNCNDECRLVGIGMYSHERSDMVYEAKIKVFNGVDGVIHEETRQYLSDEDKKVIMVELSDKIKIKKRETYEVSAEVSGAMYYAMESFNFLQDIHHDDTALTVSISPSEILDSHEIPALYFSQ